MPTAVKYRFSQVARQPGEVARLRVVQGPDMGAIFVVTGHQATIGRGEENDVVIGDLKASRRHAMVSFVNGGWEVSDFGSANGMLHNGKPTPKSILRTRDTITVGSTTLEFIGAESGTQLLISPLPSIQQLQSSQVAKQQVARAAASGASGKPKVLLMVGVAAFAVIFLLPEEKKPAPKTQARTTDASRDLAAYLPPANMAPPSGTNRTADAFYKMGFREYRERNYLRARSQFETALQLDPNHRLARMYIENCRKSIEDEINFHLEHGRRDTDSGKIKQAKGHFEAILRLLYRDTSNPAFTEAQDNLKKLVEDERRPS